MVCVELKDLLQGLAAFAAFVSAVLWVVSARVKVKVDETKKLSDGMEDMVINSDGANHIETLKAQGRWNSRAAAAAAVAAVLQGASMLPFI